jgi:alkylated DNA nucleotide flippase Atl1
MKTFSEKVVELAAKIPSGKVTTYGRLAGRAGGGAMSAQSISSVLGKAERAGKIIPWHRIVYASGKIWIDDANRTGRMKLYKNEGIKIDTKGKIVDFENKLWKFK